MSLELPIGKQGYIVNYRRSRHVIHPRFTIVKFDNVTTREQAFQLIGHWVGWETPTGKIIRGKITRVHGNLGCVAAHFTEGGLPGQAFGTMIKLIK